MDDFWTLVCELLRNCTVVRLPCDAMDPLPGEWNQASWLSKSRAWSCGYCGEKVASRLGYVLGNPHSLPYAAQILVCPECNRPSLFIDNYGALPGPLAGGSVGNLPKEVADLYDEARRCVSAQAPTAAVLLCRKLLMHIAAERGAANTNNFLACVEHLEQQHHIPVSGRPWLDYVRTRGNEANHEIVLMGKDDADGLLFLVEMLLRSIYELPARVPQTK